MISYPGGQIFKTTIFKPFVFRFVSSAGIFGTGKFRRIPKTRKTRADSSLEQYFTNNERSCSSNEYSSSSNIVKASTHFIFPLGQVIILWRVQKDNCLRLVLLYNRSFDGGDFSLQRGEVRDNIAATTEARRAVFH